jgi:hypothetical protein
MGRPKAEDSLALGSVKLGKSLGKSRIACSCLAQYMHNKMGGDEAAFATKFVLGNSAGDYASESTADCSTISESLTFRVHGGGVPVRVKGVEGIVAVIVVSGLKQHEDHQVVIEALEDFLKSAS